MLIDRRILALSSVVLLMPSVFAQTRPETGEILRKVSDVYSNAKRYHFVVKSGVEQSTVIEIAAEPPNKFRIDADGSLLGGEDQMGRMIIASDGKQVWSYASGFKQYTIDRVEEPDAESPFVKNFASLLFVRYIGFAQSASKARLVREEAVGGIDCYVVEIPAQGSEDYTWWVDKKRFIVLREDTKPADPTQPAMPATSVVFTVAQINEVLAVELFKFTPPAGSKLVEDLGVL